MNHVVELGDDEVGIADQRVIECRPLRFSDVAGPALVVVDAIDRQADDLGVALVEFRFQAGEVAQLRRANGGEVLGV